MFAGNTERDARRISTVVVVLVLGVSVALSLASGSFSPLLIGLALGLRACLLWVVVGLIVLGPVWVLSLLKRFFARHAH